jgi:hypothetical protein
MQHQTSEPEGSISDDDPTDNSESESEFTTNVQYTQNDCLHPPPRQFCRSTLVIVQC